MRCSGVREDLCLERILKTLRIKSNRKIKIFEDNQSATDIENNGCCIFEYGKSTDQKFIS